VRAVIDEISQKTLAAKLTLGMIASDAAGARREIERGARFVICGLTRIVVGAGHTFVQGVKQA
jgi:2-keto-3-deoxy-L-rhamnonate aldolase RhmA